MERGNTVDNQAPDAIDNGTPAHIQTQTSEGPHAPGDVVPHVDRGQDLLSTNKLNDAATSEGTQDKKDGQTKKRKTFTEEESAEIERRVRIAAAVFDVDDETILARSEELEKIWADTEGEELEPMLSTLESKLRRVDPNVEIDVAMKWIAMPLVEAILYHATLKGTLNGIDFLFAFRKLKYAKARREARLDREYANARRRARPQEKRGSEQI